MVIMARSFAPRDTSVRHRSSKENVSGLLCSDILRADAKPVHSNEGESIESGNKVIS